MDIIKCYVLDKCIQNINRSYTYIAKGWAGGTEIWGKKSSEEHFTHLTEEEKT